MRLWSRRHATPARHVAAKQLPAARQSAHPLFASRGVLFRATPTAVPFPPPAEGDTPIPAHLFDADGELDMAHIFCSKCQREPVAVPSDEESDEVGWWAVSCEGCPCPACLHQQLGVDVWLP